MLEKNKDVIAAYPDGLSGNVVVHAKKPEVFTEPSIKKVIESNKKFKVKSFEKVVVAKQKSSESSKSSESTKRRVRSGS